MNFQRSQIKIKRDKKRKNFDEIFEESSSSESSIKYSDESEEEREFYSYKINSNHDNQNYEVNNYNLFSKNYYFIKNLTRKKNRAEIKDLEKYLINPLLSNKKTRKELTDDDINKKNELIQKRKNNAKRQLEEEKRPKALKRLASTIVEWCVEVEHT